MRLFIYKSVVYIQTYFMLANCPFCFRMTPVSVYLNFLQFPSQNTSSMKHYLLIKGLTNYYQIDSEVKCGKLTIVHTIRKFLNTSITRLKFYKVIAVQILMYGSESWTLLTKIFKITGLQIVIFKSCKGVQLEKPFGSEEIRKYL